MWMGFQIAIAFLLSFGLSTVIIRRGIPHSTPENNIVSKEVLKIEPHIADTPIKGDKVLSRGLNKEGLSKNPMTDLPESSEGNKLWDLKSTGFWIGFCETLLILFWYTKTSKARWQ